MRKRIEVRGSRPVNARIYTREFIDLIAGCGIEAIKLPPKSPNLNAYAERFVRSIKEGCLDHMVLFGEDALRNAV
jgi:hypothetical protein